MNETRIYWSKEAEKIKVGHKEWNEILDKIEKDNYYHLLTSRERGYKSCVRMWNYGTYLIDDEDGLKNIYVADKDHKYRIYFTHLDEDKNDEEKMSGSRAYQMIDDLFHKECGIRLNKAFGTMKKVDGKYELEQCVDALPALIQFDNTYYGMPMRIYKADFSSAYPSCLTLDLPDATTAKKEFGKILPKNDEICYWIKSGHIIGMGVDTRTLENHPLYKNRHKFNAVNDNEEITIIMKKSKYSLKNIMQTLYDGRKENPQYKDAMVTFIGMLRSTKFFQKNYMGHISSLVYARHITNMCKVYDQLIAEKNVPVMYATDSIIWYGGPSKAAAKEKYLGAFHSEYEDCRAVMLGCGIYAIESEGKLCVVKHQGCSSLQWKPKMESVKTIEDFKKEYRNSGINTEKYNKKTHRFEWDVKGEITVWQNMVNKN